MKKIRTRLLSLLLVLVTVLSLLPTSALAASSTGTGIKPTSNTNYGTVSSMPEIPGLMLWKSGHAGVYIGGGYAIEAMGTRKGVVKTEVSGRGWQGWCKLPYIDYLEVE